MFGIGKLWNKVGNLSCDLQTVEAQVLSLEGKITDLQKGLSLFARFCAQCKQWKPKDLKGWRKQVEKVSAFPFESYTVSTYTCSDCMKEFKPVEKAGK